MELSASALGKYYHDSGDRLSKEFSSMRGQMLSKQMHELRSGPRNLNRDRCFRTRVLFRIEWIEVSLERVFIACE